MSLFPELDGATESSRKSAGSPPSAVPPPQPYVALARKYRPGSFDEVVGQEAAVATLKNAIATGRLHHAYLFSGIRGVGKTTAARLFARALNCAQGPTVEPCGRCDACREIAAGLSLDVIEIDAASNRGVDDVEPLREAARYAPSRDRYKVFILDEVHMLSNAAFNSLLKILEEPPPRIVWILATTEPRKVPPTVVSRCQHFEFRRVPRAEISKYLARIAASEGAEIAPRGLEVIAAAAAGSVRDAVSLLDQSIAYAGPRATEEDVRAAVGAIDRRLLVEFLRRVAARDAARLLDLIASLADGGVDFSQFAAGLVATVRDAALARFAPSGAEASALPEEEARELRELAAAFTEDGLLRAFHALLDLPGILRGSPQPRYSLEAAALRLARIADLTPIEEVIARLHGSGAAASRPGAPAPSGASPAASPRGSAPASGDAPASGASAASPAGPEGAGAGGDEPPHPAESLEEAPDAAWRDRFLEAVQSRRISLRTYLEGARGISVAGDRVEISLDPGQTLAREGLGSAEGRALLEEAASEAAGRPMSVAVVAAGGGPPAQGAVPAERGPGRRERLLRSALERPEVKRLMEEFRGQVVDIQEIP